MPILTLSLALMSILTWTVPELADGLVYDRGLVLAGEWWRLGTAPLVHFSASHLGWNLLVLLVAGTLVETRDRLRHALICLTAMLVPGLVSMAASPDLLRYGGMSGVATGVAAWLCLHRMRLEQGGLWRVLLLFIVAKIGLECLVDTPLFAQPGAVAFRPLPLTHVAGLGAAICMHLLPRHGIPATPMRTAFSRIAAASLLLVLIAQPALAQEGSIFEKGTYRLAGRCVQVVQSGVGTPPQGQDYVGINADDPQRPMFIVPLTNTAWFFVAAGLERVSADKTTAVFRIDKLYDKGAGAEFMYPAGECELSMTRPGATLRCTVWTDRDRHTVGRELRFEGSGTWQFTRSR